MHVIDGLLVLFWLLPLGFSKKMRIGLFPGGLFLSSGWSKFTFLCLQALLWNERKVGLSLMILCKIISISFNILTCRWQGRLFSSSVARLQHLFFRIFVLSILVFSLIFSVGRVFVFIPFSKMKKNRIVHFITFIGLEL